MEKNKGIYECEAFTQEGLEQMIINQGFGRCKSARTLINPKECNENCELLERYRISRQKEGQYLEVPK